MNTTEIMEDNQNSPLSSLQNDHSSASHQSSSSPQSPANFSCSICGRTYKARETLNRHKNIHTAHFKHRCSECGIGFYRKDLLDRHCKLHEPHDATRGQTQGRQRSQRACDRCRTRKMKCSSQLPCSACTKSGIQCSYTRKSDRISQQNGGPLPAGNLVSGEYDMGRESSESVSGEEAYDESHVQHDLQEVTPRVGGFGNELSSLSRHETATSKRKCLSIYTMKRLTGGLKVKSPLPRLTIRQ
jgi:hypothetical protein